MEGKEAIRTSINRSSEYRDVIDILVSRGGDRVFKAMYELLCFAAYIGINNKNRLIFISYLSHILVTLNQYQ